MHGHRGMAIDRPSLAGRGHSNRTRKENPCTKSTSNIVRTPFLYVPTNLLPALPVSFAECVLSSATMSFAVSTLITQKYSQNRKKHQKGEPSAPHKKRWFVRIQGDRPFSQKKCDWKSCAKLYACERAKKKKSSISWCWMEGRIQSFVTEKTLPFLSLCARRTPTLPCTPPPSPSRLALTSSWPVVIVSVPPLMCTVLGELHEIPPTPESTLNCSRKYGVTVNKIRRHR